MWSGAGETRRGHGKPFTVVRWSQNTGLKLRSRAINYKTRDETQLVAVGKGLVAKPAQVCGGLAGGEAAALALLAGGVGSGTQGAGMSGSSSPCCSAAAGGGLQLAPGQWDLAEKH